MKYTFKSMCFSKLCDHNFKTQLKSFSLFCSDIYQILPHLIDHPKDLNGHGKHSRMESGGGVGEMCTLRSVYVDSSLECSPLSRVNYYGGHMEGSRQSKTRTKSVFSDHLKSIKSRYDIQIQAWSHKSDVLQTVFVLVKHCGGETHMRRVNIETDPSFTVFHLPPINQSPLVNSSSDITLTMVRIQYLAIQSKKPSEDTFISTITLNRCTSYKQT